MKKGTNRTVTCTLSRVISKMALMTSVLVCILTVSGMVRRAGRPIVVGR